MWVDSHCHPNDCALINHLGTFEALLQQMSDNDVDYALAVGVTRESSDEVCALAKQHAPVFAAVGQHPAEQEESEWTFDEIIAYGKKNKVVAIGETGLDYHWCSGDLTWQKKRFEKHIEAALQLDLPIIVHTRKATSDTLDILRAYPKIRGVIHCFTEDVNFARSALDLGFYISFSGIVSFKNATEIQAACTIIPDDFLLIETDAPYLAPVPFRGKINQPAYVRHTGEFVAQLRNQSIEKVAQITSENFFRLFDKAKGHE